MALPQSNDLASTWAFLEEGIEVLMTQLTEGMSYDRYMQLYTVAYNYCTSSRMINTGANDPLGGVGARSGANLMGADLYKKITDYFIRHLAGVRRGADNLTDEALLKYYVKEWDRYTTGANFVHRLFVYLNRHWVKREKDEGRRNIYAVFTLALVQWKDQMFVHVQNKSLLVNSLLKQIEKQRNGETIDNSLVKKIIDSFVSLGLDEMTQSDRIWKFTGNSFESPFILNTEQYYKQESNDFVAQNSVTDYMKKVEARLKEEEDRVELYLHSSTRNKLVGTCERVLVQAHESLLHDEFQKLLDKVASEDLQRMYSILFRVPKGLEPLRNKFKEHVKREGESAIEKTVGTNDNVDPTAYVKAILEVHSRATLIVDTSFNKEAGFYASLDKACEDFINSNAASKKPGKTALEVSPNLLSQHVNALLKKSNKDSDDASIEASLTDVMTVFKYVTEKDVFLKFYTKHLARRLTAFLSASEDAETNMIGKLKEQCGTEYTTKPQAMFTDMNMSKELNQAFKSWLSESVDDRDSALIDAEVLVLGAAHWPLQPSKDAYSVPSEITHTVTRFERFYDKKHSGRKLVWLWQYGTANLQTKYLSQKLLFMTNAYQAAILLLFNTMDSLTIDQIHDLTQMPKKIIEDQCGSAIKLKIMNREGDTLTLNKGFKSKNMRVKLNVPIKGEQKLETADVMKSVDEDRKFLIQATIVRIMKSRKTMKHAALMQETVSQVSSRFAPKVPDIKKAIDHLIEKEFIERKDGEKDTYSYIA